MASSMVCFPVASSAAKSLISGIVSGVRRKKKTVKRKATAKRKKAKRSK